ncbi:leucyl aminopeptidase [Patescibacteria group bacterium]|nr:leucyl aminopeptidase [Patescibacteria group bacterium]
MKLTFKKGSLDSSPKGYTRIRLTEESRGTKRVVREGTTEWMEIGAGKAADMNRRKFVLLCRSIVKAAKDNKCKKIAIQFDQTPQYFSKMEKEVTPEEVSRIAAENFEMANFEFTTYKAKPKEGWVCVEEILLYGKSSASIERAIKEGQTVGQYVNTCRDLANTPSSDMPPQQLAKTAKKLVAALPVTVTTLGKTQMQKLGMGGVLGVGKGSSQDPAFIVMEYKGAAGAPIVLVGKGVTFDSGGINLKSDGGHEMHMDMSGGAAVISTVALAAKLKLKKHVIGLIPAVENMPGPSAYRIHDVLKTLSGKTIEVMHTDAEGRVILADALTYAKRFNPSVVIDVATLTGACHVALGDFASGLFTRDDSLARTLEETAEKSGDYIWRLPLWDEYEPAVRGTIGDVVNAVGGASGRYGGATNAAMFLWQFAKELKCPWAHLDIAPRMTAASGEELSKGAAGAPVRLLISFIESWK